MDDKVRWEMQLRRGGIGRAKCDNCGDRLGTDVHHIVSRGRTHNVAARRASEAIELLGWVCGDCHIGSRNVHNPESTRKLLAFNATLFGRERVQQALDNVNQYLSQPITMEGEDGENRSQEE